MTRDWMIRKLSNELLGPMSVDEVRDWVKSGKLDPDDELCSTGDYWFFVHESEELRARLGVEAPQPSQDRALEATQAITKTMQTKEISGDLPQLTPRVGQRAPAPGGTVQAPLRTAVPSPQPRPATPPPSMSAQEGARRGFEGIMLWKWATFILAFGLIIVTAKVFMIAKPMSGQSSAPPPPADLTPDLQKTDR